MEYWNRARLHALPPSVTTFPLTFRTPFLTIEQSMAGFSKSVKGVAHAGRLFTKSGNF